jgi:hypothetical protein
VATTYAPTDATVMPMPTPKPIAVAVDALNAKVDTTMKPAASASSSAT